MDRAAIGQRQVDGRPLDGDGAAGLEEAGHVEVHASGCTHHLPTRAVMAQGERPAGAGGDLQAAVAVEVDHAAVCHIGGKAMRQVDVHTQRAHVQRQVLGQADRRIDCADAGRQGGPALAGMGRAGLGADQRHAELDITDRQAAGVGVDRAVCVAVRAVADEGMQASAADADQLGVDPAAIGHRDGLRTALEAERSADVEEVAHTQVDIASGAHVLAQAAVEVQRQRAAGAGDHVDLARPCSAGKVDHPCIGINAVWCATDQVQVDGDVPGGDGEVGHADHRHAAGGGLQRGPLQAGGAGLAGTRREQGQREVDVVERQTDRVGIGFTRIDRAVAVGIGPVRAVQAGEGMQVLAAKGQHVDLGLAAIGQHHIARRPLKAQRSRGVDEVGQLDLEVARGAHQGAQLAGKVDLYRGRGTGGHRQHRTGVVDDIAAIGAGIDGHRHVAGVELHQRQAHLGGGLGLRVQAEPAALRSAGGRLFQVHRQADVQPGQLKACGGAVDRLVGEAAVVVGVQTVRSVQADEGLQAGAAHQPAPGVDDAAIGQLGRGIGIAQREHAVCRQEVGGRQRHADGVAAASAEVVGVEEHAQRIGIGLGMGTDAHLLGQRAMHHVQAEGLAGLRHLQHRAAVTKAGQAGAHAELAGQAAGADQVETLGE